VLTFLLHDFYGNYIAWIWEVDKADFISLPFLFFSLSPSPFFSVNKRKFIKLDKKYYMYIIMYKGASHSWGRPQDTPWSKQKKNNV